GVVSSGADHQRMADVLLDGASERSGGGQHVVYLGHQQDGDGSLLPRPPPLLLDAHVMAIKNATAAVAGLSETSDLPAINDCTYTGLFRITDAHTSGEMPLLELVSGSNSLEIRADSYGSQ